MIADNKKRVYGVFRWVVPLLMILVFGSVAQEPEVDLLGQLYHDIISSVPKGAGADSMPPELKQELLPDAVKLPGEDIITVKSSERLTQEIESMVREANERHSESVRFMLDTK